MLGNNSINPQLFDRTIKTTAIQQPANKQIKILCWSDSVIASTGFGTVARHILKALHATGIYEIDQLGINYFGDFYDRKEYPYTIVPAKLKNPADPYGNQMFLDAIQKKDYDILFIINDTFVLEGVANKIKEVRDIKIQQNRKPYKIIYYYPVDSRFMPYAASMVKVADFAVPYTFFTKEETEKVLKDIKLCEPIYHGSDTESFHPVAPEERQVYRKQFFNITDEDTFLWINVNRNTVRKDIPQTIYAFHEFRKRVPNSKLYLHTVMKDGSNGALITDLQVPLQQLGLDPTKDVLFPNQQSYTASNGYPLHLLNKLINCADAYITTAKGEGFGLNTIEAMACGVPVIAGDHTSTPEILGKDRERGYIYPCKEWTYLDNSGFRKSARLEDIVNTMCICYDDWRAFKSGQTNIKATRYSNIKTKGLEFVKKYSWATVCQQWIKLFETVSQSKVSIKPTTEWEKI